VIELKTHSLSHDISEPGELKKHPNRNLGYSPSAKDLSAETLIQKYNPDDSSLVEEEAS